MHDCDAESEKRTALEPGAVPSRYRCQLLYGARPTGRGLVHRDGDESRLLAWSRVRRVFAAEIGEPEGVRTVVIDLVTDIVGSECVAFRMDAEPGDTARDLARAIEGGVGSDRCDFSLRAVASAGFATHSHPDLEPFDQACLEALRSKPFQ
ncbi:MAG: hypothetical protein ABFS46_17545 [Myxococcota bacterium]